jgi:DNA-binding response OmpR family regulator
MDLPSHRITKNGAELSLTKKEFEILELFLSRPGDVITRDEFLNKLWGEDVYVTHRVVDTHMAALRKKIEDDPNNPKHILSVRGVGYRLDANSAES